jgi:beta-glucanase (GH16 family)
MRRTAGQVIVVAIAVACGLIAASVAGARQHRHRARRARVAAMSTIPSYTKLVFSDEFTGPAGASVDASKWVQDVGAWGYTDKELQTYTDGTANASLDGAGHLVIVARRQTATGPDGRARRYTSARIETAGKFSLTYGRIEARMQIPAGTGLWPAFWMLGDNITTVGWPACGEIDVTEVIGQNPFTSYGTLHGPIAGGPADYAFQHQLTSGSSLASGFHTYGVVWSPGSITWTLDGHPYATIARSQLPPNWGWVYDHAFHLVLDLAVGGTWPGAPTSGTQFPARLVVDWVRAYQ